LGNRRYVSALLLLVLQCGYFYWYFNQDVIDKITAGNDVSLPKKEREALAREAEQTRAALVRAFHQWPR